MTYSFHRNTWCNLLSDLFKFVRKSLSVFRGFDRCYWCPNNLKIERPSNLRPGLQQYHFEKGYIRLKSFYSFLAQGLHLSKKSHCFPCITWCLFFNTSDNISGLKNYFYFYDFHYHYKAKTPESLGINRRNFGGGGGGEGSPTPPTLALSHFRLPPK